MRAGTLRFSNGVQFDSHLDMPFEKVPICLWIYIRDISNDQYPLFLGGVLAFVIKLKCHDATQETI